MWLITTPDSGTAVTAAWFVVPKKYQLGLLGLMLWGLAIMILVDHIMGYGGSGPFLEMETDGLIENGPCSELLLIPIFTIWEVVLTMSKLREYR